MTTATYRLQADTVWRRVEGEIVALARGATRYLAINEVGTLLWPMLVEGATEADLAMHLVERFGLQQDEAEHDVRVFLAALQDQGLVSSVH